MGKGSQEGRAMRIVLVDDQELIRFSIRSVLPCEEDIEVVGEASTGRESLDLCRRLKPDLVLIDIEMPEMDGIEATRRIKEDLPETNVLMLTSQDDPDYLLEAIQVGPQATSSKRTRSFR
jgi:DNA-binding NarL/FixJ family response regulator